MASTSAVNRRSATAVSNESPVSIPTVRATTASALALPCTSGPVTASSTVVTGAIARPKPRPAASRTTVDAAPERARIPAGHRDEGRGGQGHSAGGHQARRDLPAQPAAGHRADRHGDQQPEEDERRPE